MAAKERAIHLDYFDPAVGKVPNPGMGVQGYVYSDHMRFGYTWAEIQPSVPHEMTPLDRKSLECMAASPHCDNLYYRCEWRDIQQEKGKLSLPKEFEWMLEACEKYNKTWSFRIMSSSVTSVYKDSVPEFIKDHVKMIPYWRTIGVQEWYPKYFPEYSSEFLQYWNELNCLLGERFDKDPRLEFADVSGYGFWGEAHHYSLQRPDQKEEINWEPDNVEEVTEFLMESHLKAFPTTPACMNLHYTEYGFADRVLEQNGVWLRRDSFQAHMNTEEYRWIHRGAKKGAMIWEPIRAHIPRTAPLLFTSSQMVQHCLDYGANYFGVAFTPWDFVMSTHNYQDLMDQMDAQVGYRLRPAMAWRRENADRTQDLVLQLLNDGCGAIPGALRLKAYFPDGSTAEKELPVGAPFKGDENLFALPIPERFWGASEREVIRVSASLKMRGKEKLVRWAVRQELENPFEIVLPLRAFVD